MSDTISDQRQHHDQFDHHALEYNKLGNCDARYDFLPILRYKLKLHFLPTAQIGNSKKIR
jgi:hypothetical protein